MGQNIGTPRNKNNLQTHVPWLYVIICFGFSWNPCVSGIRTVYIDLCLVLQSLAFCSKGLVIYNLATWCINLPYFVWRLFFGWLTVSHRFSLTGKLENFQTWGKWWLLGTKSPERLNYLVYFHYVSEKHLHWEILDSSRKTEIC